MDQGITAPSPSSTMVAAIVFPGVCSLVVAARFQAKRFLKSNILLDDWLTIPALITTIGMGIALAIGVARKGLGYPTPQPLNPRDGLTFLAPETIVTRKVEFAIELLQFPALTCTKLSLLFFYRRVFCTPWREALRVTFSLLITICILWGLGFFFSMAFICGTYFPAFWNTVQDLKTHCPHLHMQETWLACSDCAIDAVIFLIPIPLVLRMHMTTKHKLAVLAVFLFAAITVAPAITRMVVFLRAIHHLKKRYESSGHDNLIITAGLYWTMVETGLGLIVACLPSLYVLGRAVWTSRLERKAAPCVRQKKLAPLQDSFTQVPPLLDSSPKKRLSGSIIWDAEQSTGNDTSK